MENIFICPKCNGILSIDNDIIFTVRNPKWEFGLLLLSKELGDYEYKHNPEFDVKIGDTIDFLCPICHADLSLKENKQLVKILMKDNNGKIHTVLFSKTHGEKCTYKIHDGKVEYFGDSYDKYLNFINLSINK